MFATYSYPMYIYLLELYNINDVTLKTSYVGEPLLGDPI